MKHILLSLWIFILIASITVPLAPAQAQSERLSVVATYSILGDVIARVAGDVADVDVLMPLGADPHTYSPSGTDLALLQEADVIFSNGVNYEETLVDILENSGTRHVIASACVPIWSFEAAEHAHAEETDHDHAEEEGEMHEGDDHADEDHEAESAIATLCEQHYAELAALRGETPAYWEDTLGPLYQLECEVGADDHANEADHEHEHGSCDPHVWLDPHTGILWALLARDTLSELDPANADIYAENAATFIAELSVAIDEIDALYTSIPSQQRVLIATHQVLGYIAHAYGFESVFAVIPSFTTAAEPSAQDIVELVEVIEDEGVNAVFSEATVNPTIVERLAEETGVQIVLLYTESLSAPDGPAATYIDLLLYNARAIHDALNTDA
ncbi:MAG: hypothetical protein CUN55_02425 [Phototrophicales bacterium]|nr:MAG: hypothetical protein CUN55_02425 [Phototrophicales bacterium]